jgi:RNA polymerase sigma-70 factor (ECF subfamily)
LSEVPEHELKMEYADLLQQNQGQLFSYIHSLVRDLDDADDLFQQTSIVLWRQFRNYDRTRRFLPWACGVARLEVANFLRSRSRKRLYFSDELSLLLIDTQDKIEIDSFEDRREALSECVEKLRPRDRELLDECYGNSSGIGEAAVRRGRIPQSVHNSLRRIRRSLFECIHRTISTQAHGRENA